MFERLLDTIRETTVTVLMRVEIREPEEAEAATNAAMEQGEARADAARLAGADAVQTAQAPQPGVVSAGSSTEPEMAGGGSLELLSDEEKAARMRELFRRVGRNDPCPCGSGKRFKDCHGKLA